MKLHPLSYLGALFLVGANINIFAEAPVGYGPNPILPDRQTSLIPIVDIAPAVGWPKDVKPIASSGFTVNAFATGLDHPRWLYVLPNGDVLVAETNAPAKPEDGKGLKDFVMKKVMKRVGAGVESANRIILLRDKDGDGIAEIRTVFLENLNSPFGISLVSNKLYIANADTIMRFPYKNGETKMTVKGEILVSLPAGKINHHWTKNIIASNDGKYLYATVGSNSNIAENGMANEIDRAAIHQINLTNGNSRLFATGLRNPNGLAWQPQSGKLWVAVNERDELGNNLVPDYITSVEDGAFYGWPYSYYGQHVDDRVKPQQPEMVAKAKVPDYALGAHTASLGLTFYMGNTFPSKYLNGAFIGQHGSWNRKPLSGYKVIFVPFVNGKPSGMPEDILTGFINAKGEAQGRPVGVAISKPGELLVADDVGNTIWRVSSTKK